MKIGIAADHGGFDQKQELFEYLKSNGHDVTDFGAFEFDESDDYPDKVKPLAIAVSKGEIQKGIAICGSGVGVTVAANKVPGVRAALITEPYSAHQGVEHDNMNLMCLGGRVMGGVVLKELVEIFITAEYVEEERFQRRLRKVRDLENEFRK
ncbi:RpiB/LacA/LacB family sugar-phosphate isomerase [Echinicola soli]|uniref:RpiB/LacA/LacB family sugar-phosphate isomerase n=1 Tax=Echinicola soli TaxID=2591634 RepID=A0A514CJL0_9BACT|nr:RpiB/LacA/LacB family sugar-phosphate isomerase [Echinicola soli]QDH79999.1 RpiB/LacA/LacB family sugar-phosphate isomerase [Echinicola soli]